MSVWWLLALVFYPVADLLWSIARRLRNGASPFAPDNQHFHNLLFAYIDSSERSSSAVNTLTGVLIALLFSGLPALLTFTGVWAVQESVWVVWVCCSGWLWHWLEIFERSAMRFTGAKQM